MTPVCCCVLLCPHWQTFLQDRKLDQCLPAMQSRLGVGLLSDLPLLTPEDVSKLGLKAVEERRLLLELERLRSGLPSDLRLGVCVFKCVCVCVCVCVCACVRVFVCVCVCV